MDNDGEELREERFVAPYSGGCYTSSIELVVRPYAGVLSGGPVAR